MKQTSEVKKPAFETVYIKKTEIACDGGGGPLGHPKVYLYLKNGEITCPYCSRKYVLKES